jgi:hypothetical protein
MDRISRCGREDPGSIPGCDKIKMNCNLPFMIKYVMRNKYKYYKYPEFLFKTMNLFFNSKLEKIYQSDQQFEEKTLKYIKNNLQKLGNKLDKWYIFSHNKKTKMVKSKIHMLKLQKNIIKRYKTAS